jgi:hypothetical protein
MLTAVLQVIQLLRIVATLSFPSRQTQLTLALDSDQSSTLIDACFAPRVEYHDGGLSCICAFALFIALMGDMHFTGHHPPTKASWSLFFRDYISSFGPDGTGERGGPAIELSPVAEPKIEDGLATPPRLSLRAQL